MHTYRRREAPTALLVIGRGNGRLRPNTWDRGFALTWADLTTPWSAQSRKPSTAVLVRRQRPWS